MAPGPPRLSHASAITDTATGTPARGGDVCCVVAQTRRKAFHQFRSVRSRVRGAGCAGSEEKQTWLTATSIFQLPWQKIVTSTEGLAKTHQTLAHSIGTDVETPLREWSTKDRDMQQMTNIIGNIQAIAKELENAQKKSERLTGKGGKADTGKVANAASGVESALGQWESQAPYVFERLQAVDEARVDHMRNVLTQYQTYIIEASSALSSSAEESLNAILNVQTADEIKTFAMKSTKVMPKSQRRMSLRQDFQPPPTTEAGPALAPVASLPRPDDESSHRSNSCKHTLNYQHNKSNPHRSSRPSRTSRKTRAKI